LQIGDTLFLSAKIISISRNWRASYGSRLIREDIRDLESVSDIDKMELLYEHLPVTVGSVLSINSLREDLEVNHQTVKRWIDIFEKNYICFRIPPFGAPKLKAVKKEQKLYFWDWGMVSDEAKRFENLVALHLLRMCHWALGVFGDKLELRYFRDVVGHEVDFIILKNKQP
jgi:predicted AAA+ superfamily ATPase